MPVRTSNTGTEQLHHVSKIREMLEKVSQHARADTDKITDPKLQALFETTAEVLDGLTRACNHAEHKSEQVWA